MLRYLLKGTGIKNNQGNMTPSKEHNKFLVDGPKKRRSGIYLTKIQNNYTKDAQKTTRKHR